VPKTPPSPQIRSGPLFLLDGMSLAYRAYFALPATLTTTSGMVTNAVHGFVSMVQFIIREHQPASFAVAFDLPGDTFRDEMVADYKAGRAATPNDLLPQFEMIREVMHALAVPVVEAPGYEADDVLATLATEARDRGTDVVVVTGDRDSFQLIEDPHIRVLYNRRGVSDYSLYDEAGIVERCGVPPSKYVMLAALRGDPSDNLPGIPGVGEKTAAKLLNNYGDLNGIFAHVDQQTPKLRENLTNNEGLARSNAAVIPLVRDVPLTVHVNDLQLGGWDLKTAEAAFAKYELKTHWQRIEDLLTVGALGEPIEGSALPAGSGTVLTKDAKATLHELRHGTGTTFDPGVLSRATCGPSWWTSARCACRSKPRRRPRIWTNWPKVRAAWWRAGAGHTGAAHSLRWQWWRPRAAAMSGRSCCPPTFWSHPLWPRS
jgi:5'-3' exonuclease